MIGLREAEIDTHLNGIDGIAVERPAHAGIDGKGGGESERRRTLQAGLAEEVQQRGLVLVDGREARLDALQAGLEDELHNALLLVAEKRLDGVSGCAEESVEAANDLGEIGADDRGARGPANPSYRPSSSCLCRFTTAEIFWLPKWTTAKTTVSCLSVIFDWMWALPMARRPRRKFYSVFQARTVKQKRSVWSG